MRSADLDLSDTRHTTDCEVALPEHFSKRLKARAAARLSESVARRLASYGAIAGAGVLAMGQPAHADVIVTSSNKFVVPGSVVSLDLNDDGIADLRLGQSLGTFFSPTMPVKGAGASNGVLGFVSVYQGIPHAVASRLAPRAAIGPGGLFQNKAILGEARCCFATYYYGPWAHGGNGFLGLRFAVDGEIHYGWAELKVRDLYQTRLAYGELLVAYAYDTVPNQPIFAGEGLLETGSPDSVTPEPGTLGLLALGSLGLGFWRRRKAVANQQ